ncbi:cupin domain-containing protein [Archangium violaceum]|uniref:cupin domain-containing protein n=1 Tax=Archangium violaceum TaxID=83451 RepID=UPI001951CFE8|nr:cupin domain-containing protein [Archangium violaceum]QRN96618.1 cupin domain-containing protein [Archangium violaceum]
MKPANHPPTERLLAYATGAVDVPMRLLVETHLSFCARCAREVGRLGEPGGTLLEAVPEEPVPEDLFGRIWAEAGRHEQPRRVEGLPLPPGLLAELPPPERWHWHPVPGGGCRMARLVKDVSGGSGLYLIQMNPGARFPRHAHLGVEEGLVVAGGAWDRGRFLEEGDWGSAPAGSRHEVIADAKEGCWTLVREERDAVRLSGWWGVLQRTASLLRH